MKPIAMRCNEQQFEEIKPILEKNGLSVKYLDNFKICPYLVNNISGYRAISNVVPSNKTSHKREIFEEWDMNTFLEYCDIKPELPKSFAIKHKPCRLWFEYINWLNCKYESNYAGNARNTLYGVNSYGKADYFNRIEGFARDAVELTLEQWDKIVNNQTKQPMNKTVKGIDVLRIHAIVCTEWKNKIVNDYLHRITVSGEITFTQEEINEGFKAAKTASNSSEVITLLEEVFGKQVKSIDYDKIKTGSKVMLKYTGDICGEHWNNCIITEPFTVVFYKTEHYINNSNTFYKQGTCRSYCTFHQGGKFVLFAANSNVDYIVEVLEY